MIEIKGRLQMKLLTLGGVLLAIAVLAPLDAPLAVTNDFATDVPSTLGGTTFTPNQIVRNASGTYSLTTSLAPGVEIGALDKDALGVWYFAPAFPVNIGGVDYQPRDIVSYNGSTYALYLSGSAAGIPADARIDSLFFDSVGRPVLSFDAPVTLSGTSFGPSDLVLKDASFTLYWS